MNPVRNKLPKATADPQVERLPVGLSADKAGKTGISNGVKKILYFGIYDPSFIRNHVIISGFEENGYEVVQVCVDPQEFSGIRKYIKLYRKGKKCNADDFECIIVGFPGAPMVPLARLLFGRKVIFDAFLSLYDANVNDRKLYGLWSVKGLRDWLYDWLACKLAARVLLPENIHINYFVKAFGIPHEKFIRVFTGANDKIFHPRPDVETLPTFTAHFHGNFIPLQGVQYIIDAAHILRDEEIRFQLIGSGGALFQSIQKKVADLGLKNIDIAGRKPLSEIPIYIARSHICLGVFGDSDKAKRVISNKVYEYIAMGAAVITARTPAMEELLTDRENVLFCNSSDGKDMAEKILILKKDKALREKIANGGYQTYKEQLTPHTIVSQLLIDFSK